jgi:hypothetical protein
VRPAPLHLALVFGLALAGCGGQEEQPEAHPARPSGEGPDASHESAEESAEARAKREADAREVAALLPLEAGRVLWYRATTTVSTPQGPAPYVREVALYTTRGPSGEALLELVGGLAAPWDALCFWRGPREVAALHEGGGSVFLHGREPTARGGTRLWTPDPTWDANRGRRLGWEQVGEWRAMRTEHGRAGEQLLRTWLARDVGVVQLEVIVEETRVLLLELVERGPRGAPGGGYDASSPGALWKSLTVALRRLDVDAFEALLGPALRQRERRTGWDEVKDLVPPAELRRPRAEARADPEAARDRELAGRIRAEVGDLLSLDVKVRGAWRTDPRDPTVVTAPALVTHLEAGAPHLRQAVVVLGRHGDRWSWDDLRLQDDPR